MSDKGKNVIADVKNSVLKKLDQNGNGELDIADIIALAIKLPGVHVKRDAFLQKELFKNHPKEVIETAIASTPAVAGISAKEIDKIADEVIKYERVCVSGISAALGAPGGPAMAATIPADILQYYGYTLRVAQKLLYLYGFPDIGANEDGLQLDTETLNTIILCLGVMNGVAGANKAINGMAKALAAGVEKKILKARLNNGVLLPFAKKIMSWFNVKLTKAVLAGFSKKVLPIVGGIVGGGITFFSFKPCCYRLKKVLADTMLSNPAHVSTDEENAIYESIVTGRLDKIVLDDAEDYVVTPKDE